MGTTRLPLLLTSWRNNKGRWVVPNLVYKAGFNSTAHKNLHFKCYTHNNLILEQKPKEIFQFFSQFSVRNNSNKCLHAQKKLFLSYLRILSKVCMHVILQLTEV